MTDEQCVFCRIVAGSVEASRVYEDDAVLAFMDVQPANPGHLLVVPKVHAVGLPDLDAALGAAMFSAAQRLAAALRASELPCDGVNLFLADGQAASQEVPHVHLHVLPRTAGDGFTVHADWRQPPRRELDRTAAAVRAGLASAVRPGEGPTTSH